MKPEIKARWVAALRDTEKYQKTMGALHSNKDGGFCCLGVLCDLYLQDHGKEWASFDGASAYAFPRKDGWEYAVLPVEVQEWAGLREHNKAFAHNPRVWSSRNRYESLATWNDDMGLSLPEIANLIEESDL